MDASIVDAGTASSVWPFYGHDLGNSNTSTDERRIGRGNASGLEERWRVQFGDGATSTPVVFDGTVYFGSWDGNVFAADAKTGEIRWQNHVTSMMVRSTPLVTKDRVFAAAGYHLVALDRVTGNVLWRKQLETNPAALIESSPKLVDGLLIIGVSSVEISIPKEDYTFIGAVVAIDAETGQEVWRVETTGNDTGPCPGGAGASVWSSAALDEELGLAFIGTGQNYETPTSPCADSLLALHYARDYQGQRIAWVAQYTKDDVFAGWPLTAALFGKDADVGASPNLFEAGGKPLVGAGDKGGSYRTFDRRTGERIWRTDLDVGTSAQVGGVLTTAAVHDDTIYVASNHWDVGSFVFNGTHDPADVATLYALDTLTGAARWTAQLSSPIVGALSIANGLLYHTIINHKLFARDLKTGAEVWSTRLDGNMGSGASIVDGRIYVSSGLEITATQITAPAVGGGYVASYGLEDGPRTVWDAKIYEPPPMTEPECESAIAARRGAMTGVAYDLSAECATCLCQCDATASGNCDACWTLAPCVVQSCWLAASGQPMRDCLAASCAAKLIPSFIFRAAADVAPCAIKCAAVCKF
jgi:polyvinyl alcohol dehydrogenase (cytochrome)